ncbi:addiction module antidote protein, HigA family [Candidatus Parcubacteria bacterium]|nr:MAG: addiction module antidote protein, HigA family [Candidatus Parcubacteria bacterium]
MVRVPSSREPTHPGEVLREEFLKPLGISQKELAESIHVPYQRINELINRKRGVTPSTALRLARYFGTTAGFWMNLQLRWELYRAQQREAQQLEMIAPRMVSR